MKQTRQLTPERIRAIRERLSLTQEEAGKLLGGGPRAFTKYEAGSLKPSTATINLLRILEVDPSTLGILSGRKSDTTNTQMLSPFEIKADDITSLKPHEFVDLLQRLLIAEAEKHGLPHPCISVPSNINAPDGGEDGRISWQGGPSRTRFLPSRICQFQLKTGEIGPAAAGRGVLTKEGKVKPLIRSVLEQHGHYILLCAKPYTQLMIDKRQRKILDNLANAEFKPQDQVRVLGADELAMWVNSHVSVALWFKEKLGLGTLGGFVTWNHWNGRHEHSVPWVEDPRLADLCHKFMCEVTRPGSILRIVGLSGIGKSRLCLEAFRRVGKDESAGRSILDFVMYTVQSEAGWESIPPIVEKLANSGGRAVVVVDDCDARLHGVLAGLVLHKGRLSLVTIDNEVPSQKLKDTIQIEEAPTSVTKTIIERVAPTWSDLDRQRLAHLSGGFPEVAIRIARESDTKPHLTYPVNDHFIDVYVCGRNPRDQQLWLQTAQLIAVFGPVSIEPSEESNLGTLQTIGSESTTIKPLARIIKMARELTFDDLHAGIQHLVLRGVIKRKGGMGVVQPRPIAVRLAERQWREWTKEKRDRVLTGETGVDLSVNAARCLAQLNATEIASQVVEYVCRIGGPFDQEDSIISMDQAEVLEALAEINAKAVAECIERSFDHQDNLGKPRNQDSPSLVRALAKIAFNSGTFMIGGRLLLRLAVSENTFGDPSVSRRFTQLFTPVLGGTEADGKARLLLLDEAVDTNNLMQLERVVEALLEGVREGACSRIVGAEIQGSRKVLKPWWPASNQELSEYILQCTKRLGQLAVRNDSVGENARKGFFGCTHYLLRNGHIDLAKQAINTVVAEGYSWTQALRTLKALMWADSDHMNEEITDWIRSLIASLEPKSLCQRVQVLITEPPMSGMDEKLELEERLERQKEKVKSLASELLADPVTLKDTLTDLSSGTQYAAGMLGHMLAKRASSPLEWLEPIAQAVANAPVAARNYDLLSTFVGTLPPQFHNEVEKFKARVIESPDLAPSFPKICAIAGVIPMDITHVIAALGQETLSPGDLHHWTSPWVLEKSNPRALLQLLDMLLDHSAPSFQVAVIILGQILFVERAKANFSKLADKYLHALIKKMALNAGRWNWAELSPPANKESHRVNREMAKYHFDKILLHMLSKGRKDSIACKIALNLALTLAKEEHDDWSGPLKPSPDSVLRRMLSDFPEIVWPIIGKEIAMNDTYANRMKYVLGCPYTFGRSIRPPILDLPEEALFAWCHSWPKAAPFVATCVPFLSTESNAANGVQIHPIISRLLSEFGKREDVRRALENSLYPLSWVSSPVNQLARLQQPLKKLETHPIPSVRQWANKVYTQVERWKTQETARHEERKAQGYWLG